MTYRDDTVGIQFRIPAEMFTTIDKVLDQFREDNIGYWPSKSNIYRMLMSEALKARGYTFEEPSRKSPVSD